MRVALFGATGFVGSYLIDALVAAGHEPVALVRPGSENKLRQPERCHPVPGNLDDAAAIAATLRDCEAAIFLVGILREDVSKGVTFKALQEDAARRVIDAAKEQGVRRFLLMSANGVDAAANPYQRTKLAAEQALWDSGLDGVAFRPSVIFGDPRGRMEFCTQLSEQMIDLPLPAPLFFRGLSPKDGSFRMSPVHVEDVANAFVRALGSDLSGVQPLGGNETLRWPEILRRIADARGRRKLMLPAPAFGIRTACLLLDRFQWFPITRDQLDMLLEGNVVEERHAFAALGIEERGMSVDEIAYLGR